MAIECVDYIDCHIYLRLNEFFVNDIGIPNFVSDRVKLFYSLGAINDEEFFDLNKIISIRNNFAHDFRLKSFDNQKENFNFKILSKLKTSKEYTLREKFFIEAIILVDSISSRIYNPWKFELFDFSDQQFIDKEYLSTLNTYGKYWG